MFWSNLSRSIPTIYGICLIIIVTCLFTRGFTDPRRNLIDPIRSFDYLRTYVELYFLILIDAFFFFIYSLLFLCNRRRRLGFYLHHKRSRLALNIFQLLIYAYALSKFLIFYEWKNVRTSTTPYEWDRFDILTMIFVPLMAIGGIAIWLIFFKIQDVSSPVTETNEIGASRQNLISGSTSQLFTDEADLAGDDVEGISIDDDDEEQKTKKEKDEATNKSLNIQLKETSSSWWRIIKLGKEEWKLYIVAFVFLFAAALCEMFQPFFSGRIISSVSDRPDSHLFRDNILWYLGISLVYVVTSGLRGFIFSITSTNLIQRLRNTFFACIMKQDIAFFDRSKTGEITSRLTSDITTVGEAVSINLNIFLRSAVQTVGTVVMMLVLSWNLFLLTLITGPLAFGTAKLYGDLMANQQKKVQDALANSNTLAEEAISTVRTVKSFANEDEEVRLFKVKNDVVRKYSIRAALYYFGYMWNGQILTVALNLGTLAYGGHLVINKRLDLSKFLSFILYQQRLGDVLDSMNNVYSGLMKASGASIKLFEYMDRKPEVTNNGIRAPEEFKGRIEFKHVTFSFPNRKDDQVLKDVSFIVEPGQQVALVGPSGSGKTTCIGLLEHFYDIDEGQILIDDIPVQDYDYKFYHQKMSLVSQEPVLHARSIKDNIQYGLIEAKSQEETEHVAKMANAHTFISKFKKGYETECGERGVQMSGGQKQRIALARALIRSPNILLLDEATSALDAEAEAQVQEAIARTVIGRTVLVIAHRLSTVRHADKILVLRHGEIVDQGTHLELMGKRGLYYELVKRQTEQPIDENSRARTTTTTMSVGIPLTEKSPRTLSTSFNMNVSV